MCASADDHEREVWLLGQPSLGRYLNYAEKAVWDEAPNRRLLVDEWSNANELYYRLAEDEAKICERVEVMELPGELLQSARTVERDDRYRLSFDSVPTRLAMVELDRMIVTQPHINLDHVERLQKRLSPRPDLNELFQFCLPLDRKEADIRSRKMGSRRYLFWSRSADLRLLKSAVLKPGQLRDVDLYGSLGRALGIMVGFGSNFLNLIEFDGRLVIHDGHHRAFALRDRGVTHAPCIVQSVTRRDELNLVASSDVIENPHFYFTAPRPPLLKDFFDSRLRKVLRTRRISRAIEISFDVREFEVTDFNVAE